MIARSPRPNAGYLDRLNEAQRTAVLHGDGEVADALLVIAGAGTGKTNTLAHRVAHLILAGADPRRILLDDLLPTRRDGDEAPHRAHRRRGARRQGRDPDRPPQLGRHLPLRRRPVLREHAAEIGLDPAFTIHDRSDAADQLNMVRRRLGLSRTESRFPEKGTCLDIYSRAVNACEPLETVLASSFPAWIGWAAELKELFAGYVEAKQASRCSTTTTCCSTGPRCCPTRTPPPPWGRASTMSSSTSIRTPTGCRRRSCSG